MRARLPARVQSTIAGDGGVRGIKPLALDEPATAATLAFPIYLLFDAAGDLLFTDRRLNQVLKINDQGVLTLVAGDGAHGFAGDGGPAAAAQLSEPTGIALDAKGDLFIADAGNQRVRRVDRAGLITTIAGTGSHRPLR